MFPRIETTAIRATFARGLAALMWPWPSGVCASVIHPNGSEGYAKAEMTTGGVSTAELGSQITDKRIPGLFVIGEAVDVTGWRADIIFNGFGRAGSPAA